MNGVEVGTGTDSSNFATKPIRVGMDYNGANGFTGYIDELRVSNNNRYGSAFTSQTGIHQGDTNTKLLVILMGLMVKHIQKIGLVLLVLLSETNLIMILY